MTDDQNKSVEVADTMNTTDETSTGLTITDDRQTQIGKLVSDCYEAVAAAPYDEYPGLSFIDHDAILGTVNRNLHLYDGPLKKDPFQQWTVALVQTEAQRYRILDLARGPYRGYIKDAIRRTLFGATEDCAVDVEDVFQEVLWLIFQIGPGLATPSKAKLSSRLYALAKRHAYSYHTKKRNRRFAKVVRAVEAFGTLPGGAECFSPRELASIAASQKKNEEE